MDEGKRKRNKTRIQWNLDVKFISAKTEKNFVKIIFEKQNQKKFPETQFFLHKKIWEKQNLGKNVLKKNFENFQLQVTIPNAHPVQI